MNFKILRLDEFNSLAVPPGISSSEKNPLVYIYAGAAGDQMLSRDRRCRLSLKAVNKHSKNILSHRRLL
jgi:hypothetical protein